MRKEERASIARLLNDLIKADSIIDIGEMEMYARLKWQYKITKEDELAAFEMTIADAMNVLSNSSNDLRESLLSSFSEMTISDGFCARQEALLMLAFIYCMKETSRGLCAIYSVHEPDVQIDDCQVVYVESAYDTNINNDIKANYRSIDKEFRLVGFNFVYIPYIISHYKNTDVNLLKEITNFLAPTISEDKIEPLVEQLTGLTTANYCNEQLCNKLRLYSLRDMPPSFLIKINHTYVKEQLYMNFLRISIDDDVLPLVRRITDIYSNMLSSDTRLVKYSEEAFGQFMYHGFYKQLFDIYIIRKGTSSNVLFDFMKESISFMEISMEIKGLHRRDKALYALLIMESENGGIDFTQPNNAKQKKYMNVV